MSAYLDDSNLNSHLTQSVVLTVRSIDEYDVETPSDVSSISFLFLNLLIIIYLFLNIDIRWNEKLFSASKCNRNN
jgi:hypothetical protein